MKNRLSRSGQLASLTLLAALAATTPAQARDYCPDRPGIDTPPCTIDPGRLSVELSGFDWSRDKDDGALADTVLAGDLALRLGVSDHAELRLAWTPWGQARSRDLMSGAVTRSAGTGDVTLGLKRNLIHPDGQGVSVALLPSVSLPTGGATLGAGDWGAGVQAPFSLPAGKTLSLLLTPELDAAVDSDRRGRHLAYGTAGGIAIAAAPGLNLAIEAAVMRDEDPAGASTQVIAGGSIGLMLGKDTQVDIGTELGLNHAAPDTHIYLGVARRF